MAIFNWIPAVCDCFHGYGWLGLIEITKWPEQVKHSMARGSFFKKIQVQYALPKEHGAIDLLN